MRICRTVQGIGPNIGTESQTDSRICKTVIGVGPEIGVYEEVTIDTEDGFYFETESGDYIILE